jgi:WD40 repeat protein
VTSHPAQITLWHIPEGSNIPEGSTVASYPSAQGLRGVSDSFAATPDLSLAAYGLVHGSLRVIDLRDGKELWTAVATKQITSALAFSPDGKILASSGGLVESNILLWDVATGKEIGRLEGHGSLVSSLVFWPDGKKLASSSGDQTIRIWDVASQKCLDVLRGHRQEVWRLALLPDDKTLVSGAKDGTVCFWDTSVTHPKQPRITLPENVVTRPIPENLGASCFARDGRSVLTLNGRGQVSRWTGPDFQQKEVLLEIGTNFYSARFSSDGRLVAVSFTNGVFQTWDLTRRVLSRQLTNTTGMAWTASFLADGNKLVNYSVRDRLLHEWNLTTGLLIQSWQAPAEWFETFCLSPDERSFMAIGAGEGDVVFRDLANESNPRVDRNVPEAEGICFSPDGKLFAVASAMGYVRVWETATWREVATLRGHLLGVFSVVFSGDGKRLATGGGNAALKLWDTESWQEVLALEGQGSMLRGTAFSPDGNVIFAVNYEGIVQLWRAPSWAEINAAEAAEQKGQHP